MNEAIKEYTDNLWKEAKLNKELADEAYEKGDLALSAFHKGMVTVYEGERLCKEDKILESEKEDTARELSMLYFQRRNLSRKLENVTNGLR